MNIAIIGTGYVGLVSGTCFAESGNDVICVDIDAGKIEALKKGKVPFYEPGLEELVLRNLGEQRLSFTTDLAAAVKQSLVLFIAVGTPQGSDGSANLRYVFDTAGSIARHMEDY
ncbi:MAG: 2-dehydropantoate 2-reductase N-terminal domain-containing protein, partial [Candidatus Binatia bacterium]